jgi:hypothetical protein
MPDNQGGNGSTGDNNTDTDSDTGNGDLIDVDNGGNNDGPYVAPSLNVDPDLSQLCPDPRAPCNMHSGVDLNIGNGNSGTILHNEDFDESVVINSNVNPNERVTE